MMITERDLEILDWVHECRFLTRRQIERLLFNGRPSSRAKLRLALLFHNGLLGRLHLPVRGAYGATFAVYYLERYGAAHVAAAQRRPLEELDWRRRDGERGEFFLRHTLDVADVRVAFSVACRRQGLELDWLDERALRRLNVLERIRRGGDEVSLLPDGYFTISGDGWADGFALEVDRGTVSERRMRARIAAYGEWAAGGRFRRHLPLATLRVLFAVTDTGRDRRRLERVKRWCEEEGGGSLFWLVDREGLSADDVLDAEVFRVARTDERVKLVLSRDL